MVNWYLADQPGNYGWSNWPWLDLCARGVPEAAYSTYLIRHLPLPSPSIPADENHRLVFVYTAQHRLPAAVATATVLHLRHAPTEILNVGAVYLRSHGVAALPIAIYGARPRAREPGPIIHT